MNRSGYLHMIDRCSFFISTSSVDTVNLFWIREILDVPHTVSDSSSHPETRDIPVLHVYIYIKIGPRVDATSWMEECDPWFSGRAISDGCKSRALNLWIMTSPTGWTTIELVAGEKLLQERLE